MKEYQKLFEETFDVVKSSRVETKMLKSLFYDYIEQIYKPTTVYQFILDELNATYDELSKRLDDTGIELLKKYEYLQGEFLDDSSMQSFVYGYILASNLYDECKNNKIVKNNKTI